MSKPTNTAMELRRMAVDINNFKLQDNCAGGITDEPAVMHFR
ncbi:MAG TPA: hypothetical protein VGE93_23600 [Bryobacteraceae bacterium]